jgi:hypothetical protein
VKIKAFSRSLFLLLDFEEWRALTPYFPQSVFLSKKKMAESDFPIFRSKKRKIEEENELDDPLLDLPLAENLVNLVGVKQLRQKFLT